MMMNQESLQVQRSCQTHPDQVIMGICLKTDCTSPNRLVCFNCLISDSIHTSHSQNVVALNQITNEGKCFGNWPQDEEGQAVKYLLQSLSKIKSHEDIDKIFSDFKKKLNTQIDIVQSDVKRVYDEQYLHTSKFVNNLEKEYNNIYTLGRIIDLLKELEKGNLNDQEFYLNVNSFLVSDERKSQMSTLREIVKQEGSKDFLSFDQKLFDGCSEKCIQSIKQFGDSFKSASSFNSIDLEIAQVKQPQTVTLAKDQSGIKFTQTSHSVVYCNKPLSYGMYKIKVRMDSYTSGCYVIGLEREANKITSNYWGQGYPACCIICKAQDAISMVTNTVNEYIGHHLVAGKIMNIEICLKKNIFTIGVEGTNVAYQLSNFTFAENEQWRLFFNNYSGAPCSFTLLSSIYSEFI
ncbi:hypothetical protein TTHERM_00535240 (macronuclear) [Tetrahymena thermophila SB210]|uniref:Uncharacterized protein n=1 Tax=Tetrahymena thermophila (strain SB210) TaxID=312017 RepID=I7MHQ3_TETTS|nr:hypothetical protein TTHERM_00535240 [Tetrahymena thermophila SB210]EAS03188.1 hypothetical protein TTHERM_00535240 [Tetrahymena thermophila SB210]|eukprot:XP_001023433.1 hypothetical protein TTHERM_00535240 [Tetrahymena thermophila SB210]